MGDSSFASGFKTGFGSAFLQVVLERVANFGASTWKEIGLIWGVEDELRKLHRTFLKIQDLVDHVESSPLRLSGGSKAWKIWFEDLQKLGYDADALLDHVTLNLSIYCKENSVQAHQEKHVLTMILKSGQLDVPHEVNRMQKKLEVLAEEVKSLLDIEQVKMGIHKSSTMERCFFVPDCSDNSSLLVDETAIVGRKDDKENIIRLLGRDNEDLSVIPLVAMGGIGKTTLAQLVYNDEKFCEDFNLKIWISVSENFDIKRITKLMIESATQQICQAFSLDSLQCKLQQLLRGQKFLLILDDYWNENLDDWDLLSAPLRFTPQGSKVIVTTRSGIVASIVGSVEAYNLKELCDDDCWTLIKQRAFRRKKENETLTSLGKEIAKKCQGLPLAAKALGSVLHTKFGDYEWLSIANSELWDFPQHENGVLPSLMLSYLHLLAHLKKCFAYCSLFPRDHEYKVEELVLLWMAEGFIQPQGEMRLEDIGIDYFNNLHMRSFFQEGMNASNHTTYKMHDLIHDLARLVSTNTCFQVKFNTQTSYPLFGNACHLSLQIDIAQGLKLSSTLKNERLRTFMVSCTQGASNAQIDRDLFSKLKFLRTLYLCDIGLHELPDSIDSLMYLRLLNLCGNCFKYLPQSMCELAALQTLMLSNCPMLVALPKDMKHLFNLRHLVFDIGGKLSFMPPEFGQLANLQTLSAFIVRRKDGHGIEELEKMDLLKGSLCIKNIDKVSNERDARKAKMNMKKHLTKLELSWEDIGDILDPLVKHGILEQQEHVLNNLEPHHNLEELEIKNYSGIRCPDWISNSLHKFTRIHLQGLVYCKALPSLGQLPFLESLHVAGMDALERVDQSFYGDGNGVKFPSLECLEVYEMAELMEWMEPDGSSCMPNLKKLKIRGCPKLQLDSLPSCLQPRNC